MIWNVPNALSVARVPLAAVFPLVVHRPALALLTLAAAAMTDVLDGWWARTRGQVTTLGSVLDPITDKLFVASVVATLVVTGRLGVVSVGCLAVREIGEAPLVVWLASSAHMRLHRVKHTGANWLGKLATVFQLASVTLAIAFPNPELLRVVLGATALVGALAAASYWARALRRPA